MRNQAQAELVWHQQPLIRFFPLMHNRNPAITSSITMVFVLAQTIVVFHDGLCSHAFIKNYTHPIYTKIIIKTKFILNFSATCITNGIVILTNLFLQCARSTINKSLCPLLPRARKHIIKSSVANIIAGFLLCINGKDLISGCYNTRFDDTFSGSWQ